MKRLFDLIICIFAITLLSPLFLIIAVLIKIDGNGSIIFKQYRVGKNNKKFEIYKFRSMKEDAPEMASNSLDDPDKYITAVGKLLRKTSLDELPQLINIIKGDMSLVGPRPVINDVTEQELLKKRREIGIYKLTPGLTGWAQVNGRDTMSVERKVYLEREYMEKQSFFFDLKILCLTAFKVLKQDGVSDGKAVPDRVKSFEANSCINGQAKDAM